MKVFSVRINRRYSIGTIIILLFVGFFSWRYAQVRVDEKKLEALQYYQKAAIVLLSELPQIENIDRGRRKNRYKYGSPPYTVLSANRSSFEISIASEIDADFQDVEKLWDRKLLEGKFHNIRMTSDSMISFKVKTFDNWASNVEHWIYYGSKEQIDELTVNSGASQVNRINDSWVYLSGRRYWILDMFFY